MGDPNPADLVIVPNPTTKLMPIALAIVAMGWGFMASLIPGIPIVGRVAAWAAIIYFLGGQYLTAVRQLVVSDEAVDIHLTRRRLRVPYTDLDHVTVRAQPLAGTLSVTFVTKQPRSVIRTRTGLMYDEVLMTAPRLIRALIVHGVDVRVPGRPDIGTG